MYMNCTFKNEQNSNINKKCLVLNIYIHPHKSLDLPKTSTTDLCLTNPDEQKLMGMLVLVLEGLAPVLVLVLVKQGQALELAVKLLVSSLVLMLPIHEIKNKELPVVCTGTKIIVQDITICTYHREHTRFIGYNLMTSLECCTIPEMFTGEAPLEFEPRETVGGMSSSATGLLALAFFSRS